MVKMKMMLQTQNLCKYFRKQKAVNNVSLNIEKGQIYGCLLYTSPSPRDPKTSRMPSSA